MTVNKNNLDIVDIKLLTLFKARIIRKSYIVRVEYDGFALQPPHTKDLRWDTHSWSGINEEDLARFLREDLNLPNTTRLGFLKKTENQLVFFKLDPVAKKYEFTGEVKTFGASVLRRIRALRDIPQYNVKAGDLGGFIEGEWELNQDGDSWVFEDGRCTGFVIVHGYAEWLARD